MVEAAVVVYGRNVARRLPDLEMRVDTREWPSPLDDRKPKGTWLALGGLFSGEAWTRNSYNEFVACEVLSVVGTTAISVTGDRFLAVVAPEDDNEPAIWISSNAVGDDPDARRVLGSFGAIRAAAGAASETLRLRSDAWTLELAEVERIYGNRYQEGQAASLLEAIAAIKSTRAGERPNPVQVDREWRAEPQRGGLYRLFVDGQPTPSSSLVDRSAAREAQVRQLDLLAWVPTRKLEAVKNWTKNELLPGLLQDALPNDRVGSPFGGLSGWYVQPGLDPHPVSRHLWPFLETGGHLNLDAGETVLQRTSLASILEQGLAQDGSHKTGVVDMPLLYSPRLHLTNMRAVLSGESHSEGRPPETWGLSIRHEWISEVGVVRRLAPPKKGLFREKPRSFTDFVYLRCGLPTKVIFELWFEPAEGHSSESVAEEIRLSRHRCR